jgi:hypothetical protein
MDQKLLSILGGDTHHYPYALEKQYPRIFATLMLLWETPEMESYLTKLMVNERLDREGFPPNVAAEIVHLSLVHAGQHHKKNKDDVWSPEARVFSNFDPVSTGTRNLLAWPNIPRVTALEIQEQGVAGNMDGYFRAAASENIRAVRLFLEAGVHLETRNEEGWTILMIAAQKGLDVLTGLLIPKGALVNARDGGGNTALHLAAFAGRLHICKVLIENQAEVDARSNFGWTPLYQAIARNHMIVASFLISHGADVNAAAKDGLTPLHKAASSGLVEEVKLLLSHGADASLRTQLGDTPLSIATKNSQDAVIELLTSVN